MNNKKKISAILLLIVIIVILLYLLLLMFGNIEHNGPYVPTGNIDIFEIDCGCNCDSKPAFNDDSSNNNGQNNKNSGVGNNKSESINGGMIVYDKYKVWDNKELRIFSNPAYEYRNIIAPGSFNSYAFVIRNDNTFDIAVDITFKEANEKNINMKYKIRNKGKYIIGSSNSYTTIDGKKIENVRIPAKSQISYILDWKWIDSHNDTEIGFDIGSQIKLSIDIGANGI